MLNHLIDPDEFEVALCAVCDEPLGEEEGYELDDGRWVCERHAQRYFEEGDETVMETVAGDIRNMISMLEAVL